MSASATTRVCLLLGFMAAIGVTCTSVKEFVCENNQDCGIDGTCQLSVGFCSVPDAECPNGQRFHESAGNQLAGQCVDVSAEPDAAVPDAAAPDADPSKFIFVDAVGGSDFNTGESGSPFKSIAKAVSVVEPGGVIFVAPGLYDVANNETFPIYLPAGVALVGDESNKGEGATATEIAGDALIEGNENAAIVMAEGSQVSGFRFAVGINLITAAIHIKDVTAQVTNNTFSQGYCGVRILGGGDAIVRNNVFHNELYGIYGSVLSANPLIENNLFEGNQNTPIDLGGGSGSANVRGNTINAGYNLAIQLQNGNHRVEDNTITKAGSFTYGCIRFQYGLHTARGNVCNVESGPGFVIENDAAPHFGIASDPGNNIFYSTPGLSHRGTATLNATGNKWRQVYLVPTCALDIEITGGGTVVYGTGGSPASCP